MTNIRRATAITRALLSLMAIQAALMAEEHCSAIVSVVDLLGQPILSAKVLVGESKQPLPAFEEIQVPCSATSLNVEARGFRGEHEYLAKRQSDHGVAKLTVGLRLDLFEGEYVNRLTLISVTNWKDFSRCGRIRVKAIYSNGIETDSVLSSAGWAGVENLPVGLYSIVLRGDAGTCAGGIVRIGASKELDVALSPLQ